MPELIDIVAPAVPPAAPLPYGWIALTIILVLAVLLSLGWVLRRRGRARRRALRRLRRAERALAAGTMAARRASFEAAAALRACGKIDRELCTALIHARFAPPSPPPDVVLTLLRRARVQLRSRC